MTIKSKCFALTAPAICAATFAASASPALAQEAGDIQIKVFGTAVLPDGSINKVNTDNIGLPAGSDTKADDNYVPTFAFEYFVSSNVSAETICCTTSHDVDGTGALEGASIVRDALIVPATVTVKYHVDLGGGLKPYIGAGPTWFILLNEKPGQTMKDLGAASMDFDGGFGAVLQAGVDYTFSENGLGLSIDAKRYFTDLKAQFYDADGGLLLETEHSVDPWVVSAGLAWRL